MTDHRRYSLGKSERLKSRKQIDRIFQSGKKITLFPYRLLFYTEPGAGTVKAGFGVSSKNFPRAVDRNRIKRLNRESYRLQKKEIEMIAQKTGMVIHLFFIFTGRDILCFEEVSVKTKQLLDKLIRTLNESNRTDT